MPRKKKVFIPKRFHPIPEKPANGKYVVVGMQRWSAGETFSEAYKRWRDDGGDYHIQMAVMDVSDDFQVSQIDGGVGATKLTTVWHSERGGLQSVTLIDGKGNIL